MPKKETPKETGTGASDSTPSITEGEIKFPSPTSIKASRDIQGEKIIVTPPIPIHKPNPKKEQ